MELSSSDFYCMAIVIKLVSKAQLPLSHSIATDYELSFFFCLCSPHDLVSNVSMYLPAFSIIIVIGHIIVEK